MTDEKILPCPFCGSEATHETTEGVTDKIRHVVECSNEDCFLNIRSVTNTQPTKNTAIDVWNNRYPADHQNALDAAGRGGITTHAYRSHPKYPWFCKKCGYAEHERLKPTEPPKTTKTETEKLEAALKHQACYNRIREFSPKKDDQVCLDYMVIEQAAKAHLHYKREIDPLVRELHETVLEYEKTNIGEAKIPYMLQYRVLVQRILQIAAKLKEREEM